MWDGRNVARPLTKPSRKRVGKASKEALVEMEKAMENMEVEVMGNSKMEENVDIYLENFGKLRKKILGTIWKSMDILGNSTRWKITGILEF